MRSLILSLLFCSGILVAVNDIRTDSDARESLKENSKLPAEAQDKAQAMADFSVFLNQLLSSPDKKQVPDSVFDKLYDALEKDPGSRELLAFVSSDLRSGAEKKQNRVLRLAEIAKRNPQQIRLNLLAAGTLSARLKDKDEEKKHLSEAVELLEKTYDSIDKKNITPEESVSLYNLLSLLYAAQKEYGKADKILDEAFREVPKEKRPELLQSAMSVYLEALKNASDEKPFPFGWFGESDKTRYTKRFDEVSNEFISIITSSETILNPETFAPSAAILRNQGQNGLALLILAAPLFSNPANEQVLKRLATSYYATGDFMNAARAWNAVLAIQRQKKVHPYDSYMHASSLLSSGNPKLAAAAFALHLKRFPKDTLPLHSYAASSLLAGDYKTASETVSKVVNPKPETLYIKVIAEERMGNYSEALNSILKYMLIRKFNNKDERYPVAIQTVMLADKAKKYDVVTSILEPMILDDPENPELLNLLGYIYAEGGVHLNKAEELLKKAVRLAPNNMAILDSMAWLLFRQKKYPEAWNYIEKSMNAFPKGEEVDSVILDHAGDISAAMGRKDEARKFWLRALSVYNTEVDRDKLMEKLKNVK